MKKSLFIFLVFSKIFAQTETQTKSSLEVFGAILQTPELSNYFNGVFDNLGIVVEETGEKFTIHNTGKQFTFENGIKESKVDFIVPVQLANIQNMVMHAKDGKIDLAESWRIVDVLFTSLTQETLKNPVMSGNWGRILAGVEDLIHVYLINPTGGEASRHTLIYVNDRWLVVKGLHGKPKRTYRMTPEESLEYQRTVFKAIKKDTYCGWWEFSTWYKEWRKKVSVTY